MPTLVNQWLENPALTMVVELEDLASHPLALTDDRLTTAELGVGPLIVSTRDIQGLPFTRPPRVSYERLVRQHGRTAYWPCVEASGDTTVVSEVASGGSLHLALQGGGQLTSVAGPIGGDVRGGVQLNGSSQYLLAAADDARLDIGTGSITLEAWVKTSQATHGTILGKANDNTANSGYLLDLGANAAGRPRLLVHGQTCELAGLTINDNAWHHVVGIYDRAAFQLLLYVDGRERARTAVPTLSGTYDSTRAFFAGAQGLSTVAVYLNGSLARLAVYQGQAHSAEQIADRYRAALWSVRSDAERRLLSRPTITQTAPADSSGVPAVETIQLRWNNSDGALNRWFESLGDPRGKRLRAHLYDVTTGAIEEDVFVGEVASVGQAGRVVEMAATGLPLNRLRDLVPRPRVRPANQSTVTQVVQEPAPLTLGWGVCENLPCRALSLRDEDGWAHAMAAGNWAVSDVSIAGVTVYDRSRYTVDVRTLVDGFPATVIRSGIETLGNVTASGRRLPDLDRDTLYEWDWMTGFRERLAGLPTAPSTLGTASTITPASLVGDLMTASVQRTLPGATPQPDDEVVVGAMLGAVLFNGTTDALSTPMPRGAALQTFRLDFLMKPTESVDGVLIAGPYGTYTGTSRPSWRVQFVSNNLEFVYRNGSTTEHVAFSVFLDGWDVVRIEKTPTTVRLYVNGVLVSTVTSGVGAIVYDMAGLPAMLFGRNAHSATPDYYQGRLGWVRFSTAEQSARHAQRTYLQFVGDPTEAAREVWERHLDEQVDDDSFAQAAEDAAQSPGFLLRVDGAVTEAVPASAVLGQLALFRDMLFRRGLGGIECHVPIADGTIVATFEVGGAYNNVVSDVTRVRPSTGEAARKLVVAYDRPRDQLGVPSDYVHRVEIGLAPVGRDQVEVGLELVRDNLCADMIMEWLQKRLLNRSLLYSFEVGHEGRVVKVGNLVSLTAPALGVFGLTCEVISRSINGPNVALQVAPHSNTPFTYEGGRDLPTATARAYAYLQIGKNPGIEYRETYTDNAGILEVGARQLSVRFQAFETAVPVADGDKLTWDTVSGAGTHWQAVSDASDSSYIETDANTRQDLFMGPASSLVIPDGWEIAAVRLRCRAQLVNPQAGGPHVREVRLLSLTSTTEVTIEGAFPVGTAWQEFFVDLAAHPTRRVWSLSDMASFQFGVGAFTSAAGESIRVSRVERVVLLRQKGSDVPPNFSHVAWWIRTTADAPAEGIDAPSAIDVLLTLDPTPYLPLSLSGTYYATAVVYDTTMRAAVTLGPTAFEVH